MYQAPNFSIDASLEFIKVDDIVQVNTDAGWIEYASIKDDADRRKALAQVQRGRGQYRIIRTGLDAKIVLTA